MIDGPERVSLAKKAPQSFYSALFVDLTRNDLRDINTDLLTKEAVADMMASLSETGILCFHTSHRFHDLIPPIIDAAASLELFNRLLGRYPLPPALAIHSVCRHVRICGSPGGQPPGRPGTFLVGKVGCPLCARVGPLHGRATAGLGGGEVDFG